MKLYRKNRYKIYDYLLLLCVLLCIAIVAISFITHKIPIMALPGLGLSIAITANLYNELSYVSLTESSLIINHKSNNKKNFIYYYTDIDSVSIKYSNLEGCKICVKQRNITNIHSILLIGRREIKELKKDLENYGVNVVLL